MQGLKAVLFALILFMLVQGIGLATADKFNRLVSAGEIEPAFENPDNPYNSVFLIAYLLVVTGIILLIIRFKKKLLLAVEALAVFLASDIVFELLIPIAIFGVPIGIVLALLLTFWKMKYPSILSQNTALVFSVSGAGAIVGASLGVLPVLLLMLGLAVYDFLSVFLTKHMVYMAKAITERPTAFTASIPYKFKKPVKVRSLKTGKTEKKRAHVFQLGGGDFAIPLIFTSSVLTHLSAVQAAITASGAVLALILLFLYVSRKPGQPLPALPPLCAGASIAFALSFLA